MQHITLRVPEETTFSDQSHDSSCLREQHIVSLITYTADGVEKSGHICDLVPRAILVTSLSVHRHSLFALVLDDTTICSVVCLSLT